MVLLWDNLSATPNRFDFDFMPNKAVSSIVPPSTAWYREVCENPTCWYNPYSSFKYYYFSCYLSKKFQSIMFILLLHLLIVYTGEIGILREWVVIKRCTLCACVGVIKRCSFVLIKVVDHFAYFGLGNIDWGYLHVVNLWLLVTSSVLGGENTGMKSNMLVRKKLCHVSQASILHRFFLLRYWAIFVMGNCFFLPPFAWILF